MENLPTELLEIVFEHLDQNDLISVTRVCKRFNSIVERRNLIKKFFIGSGKSDETWIPARDYSEATVMIFKPHVHQTLLERLADDLTTLELFHCRLGLTEIAIILRATPKVKNLKLDNVILQNEGLGKTVELPQLNDVSLTVSQCNPKIFRCLQNISIVKVTLSCYQHQDDLSGFEKLLRRQTTLKNLSFCGINNKSLFSLPIAKSKYQLEEFEVFLCDLQWVRLETYLTDHVGTLEKFTLESVKWDPSAILNQCQKLKFLRTYITGLNSLNVLTTVEKLDVYFGKKISTDRFPNVKKLVLWDGSPEILQSISRKMIKLEEINIGSNTIAGLEVKTLKKVVFEYYDGIDGLDGSFFALNNNIEELVFARDSFKNIDDAFLETITSNLQKMKVLEILDDNKLT